MKRLARSCSLPCLLGLALAGSSAIAGPKDNPSQKPNIVIILADDMGYGDVAILNRDSRIPTPNLDRLAREGLMFTDAHSPGSYCVPSRYGLLTGFNDVIPTQAEMLNVNLDDHTAEDGQSFFRALTGEASPVSFHEAIVHNHSNGAFAIRKGAFKLTVDGPKTTAQVVDDTFPVSFVLHDLDRDIEETTDVSRNHPGMVKEMHALLKKYVLQGKSNGRR